jgi:esterase FrsA
VGLFNTADFGMSFGGNFSAMTALSSAVDAAVVLGGPVDKTFGKDVMTNLPFGTTDTMANGRFRPSTDLAGIHYRGGDVFAAALLDRTDNAPMLVINGANDLLVPQADAFIVEGRAKTEVHMLPDTGHCAVSHLYEPAVQVGRGDG